MTDQQPEAPAIPGVTREQVREMVYAANEEGWWSQGGPASERVTDAIWPLLERAQAAEAKLAAIEAICNGRSDAILSADNILAITGSEEGAAFARQLVAQAKAADAEYKVAAVRAGLYEFLHQYGHSMLPAFKVAIDLAVSLRKIIDDLGGVEEAPDVLGDLKAELGEARSEGEMIRGHANRFLRAVYGPDVVYRAPETFGNLLERWLWAIGAGVPEIAHASIADIERHCAERDEAGHA